MNIPHLEGQPILPVYADELRLGAVAWVLADLVMRPGRPNALVDALPGGPVTMAFCGGLLVPLLLWQMWRRVGEC